MLYIDHLRFFSRVFMAGNIRDGTGRYYCCFDMFGGKNIEDETGRDGK